MTQGGMSLSSPYSTLFITANLGGGGAEKALLNIINHLDRARFQPHLALFQIVATMLPVKWR